MQTTATLRPNTPAANTGISQKSQADKMIVTPIVLHNQDILDMEGIVHEHILLLEGAINDDLTDLHCYLRAIFKDENDLDDDGELLIAAKTWLTEHGYTLVPMHPAYRIDYTGAEMP